ncbi:PEP-CTERM sorting domain-containing protein [Duganella aquatilis]|nr:PEP-CTERM sorting domain-containing protein [Duganella aquatilis]
MRAHEFIDADQRVPVTLPSDRATEVISMTPALDAAAVLTPAPEQPLAAQQQPQAVLPPAASPVPEPSGWVLMVLGMLLLFLVQPRKTEESFSIRLDSR